MMMLIKIYKYDRYTEKSTATDLFITRLYINLTVMQYKLILLLTSVC